MRFGFLLRGAIDEGALEASLNEVLERHPAMWFRYSEREGRVLRRREAPLWISLRVVDLQATPEGHRLHAAAKHLDAQGESCDITAPPPRFNPTLYRLEPDFHALLASTPHVVFDAASFQILWSEVVDSYCRHTGRRTTPPKPLALGYDEFARQQRAWHTGERLEQQVAWWRTHLKGAKPLYNLLPTDSPRESIDARRGVDRFASFPRSSVKFQIDREVVRGLEALAGSERASLSMAISAGFAAALGQYAQISDVVFCGLFDLRMATHEIHQTVGFLEHNVPWRIDTSGAPSFKELLRRVRKEVLQSLSHSQVQVRHFVPDLEGVFKILLNFTRAGDPLTWPGFEVAHLPYGELDDVWPRPVTFHDLVLHVRLGLPVVTGELDYIHSIWADTRARSFVGLLTETLQRAVAHPDA
jgi:hypothetical protein